MEKTKTGDLVAIAHAPAAGSKAMTDIHHFILLLFLDFLSLIRSLTGFGCLSVSGA